MTGQEHSGEQHENERRNLHALLLLSHMAQGDDAAAEELWEAYHARIVAFHRSRLPQGMKDLAEDLAQETFMKVFVGATERDLPDAFEPWLFRIAGNTFLDWLRKHKRTPKAAPLEAAPLEATPQPTAPEPAATDMRRDLASPSLRRSLSQRIRRSSQTRGRFLKAFLMGHIGELSYREIGRNLGIPKGTVGSRISRGALALRGVVEEVFDITTEQAHDPSSYELRAMWLLREGLTREYKKIRGQHPRDDTPCSKETEPDAET